MADQSVLATISGTMLVPGVSRNNRLYTPALIGKAVNRMTDRLTAPDGLPIVMRTHHAAGDDSARIVGRITSVEQAADGKATYTAELYNTAPGRDIATLVAPGKGAKPALRSVSIHGYWLGPVRRVKQAGETVETADDLEVDAVDWTASPGVLGALVNQAGETVETADDLEVDAVDWTASPGVLGALVNQAGETVTRETADGGRTPISESAEATVAITEQADAPQVVDLPTIRSKADLRRAIRAARPDAGVREHITGRATALGLTGMLPTHWTKDETMPETPARQPVGEAYVTVCVGGDQGNIVQVCVDNADGDSLKKAAKKAAKLAANFLGDDSGDGNFNVTVTPDDGDGESTQAESVFITLGGRRLSESETHAWLTRHTQTSGLVPEPARPATAAEHTTPEKEAVVTDTTQQTAVETTAPVLTDDLITKLGAVVGAAVKEAVADIKPAKVKKAKKAASESVASTPAEGKQKAGKDAAVKEAAITPEILEQKLAEERAKTIAGVRETLLAEGGLPSRKGHRFVNESDDSDKLTGDDLWNQRKKVWASVMPSLFVGTEVGDQAVDAAA